jgi:hypothetical protein
MQVNSLERGNQINLGGTERIASRFYWMLHPVPNGVAIFDAQLPLLRQRRIGRATGVPALGEWACALPHRLGSQHDLCAAPSRRSRSPVPSRGPCRCSTAPVS